MSHNAQGSRRCSACAAKPRSCLACGVQLPRRQKSLSVATCSRWCGLLIRNGDWPQTRLRWCPCGIASPDGPSKRRCDCAQRDRMLSRVKWPSCRVFITDCGQCAEVFCSPYTVSTCSPRCAEAKRQEAKRQHRDKRRALKRDAYVADVKRADIYARDKYRCKLCDRKLRMTAVVPHPLAPVLDHVVPLACGGTHEPANVQAAHFLCNSRKSHRGGGEQLLLIG